MFEDDDEDDDERSLSAECGAAVDSDSESVDSESEDLLKHAAVYTAEEVAVIFRDKLIRLQSLYIDQFKRLHHVLREKRRDYLHAKRRHRESTSVGMTDELSNQNEATQCTSTAHASNVQLGPTNQISFANIDNSNSVKCFQDKAMHRMARTAEDWTAHDKLVALKHYQRRFGCEALLHRQCRKRRVSFSSEGDTSLDSCHLPLCSFISLDNGKEVHCDLDALPLSRYCLHHITLDSCQVLYTKCRGTDVIGCTQTVLSPVQTILGPTVGQTDVSPTQTNISPTQTILSHTQTIISSTVRQTILSPTQTILSPKVVGQTALSPKAVGQALSSCSLHSSLPDITYRFNKREKNIKQETEDVDTVELKVENKTETSRTNETQPNNTGCV